MLLGTFQWGWGREDYQETKLPACVRQAPVTTESVPTSYMIGKHCKTSRYSGRPLEKEGRLNELSRRLHCGTLNTQA